MRAETVGLGVLKRSAEKMLRYIIFWLTTSTGCERSNDDMRANKLPAGWIAGDYASGDEIYSEPPMLSDMDRIQFYGALEQDQRHRLYSVPADTPVAEIVKVFDVGSHGSMSYGFDSEATVELVADKATRISNYLACKVIFADSAGLKLKFSKPVTKDDLQQLEAIFPEDEAMQAGLDRYVSEWDGETSLFAPILRENLFHFWWD